MKSRSLPELSGDIGMVQLPSPECVPCCMSRRPGVTQHSINTRRQELTMYSIGWSFCATMACEQHPHERLRRAINSKRSSYGRNLEML